MAKEYIYPNGFGTGGDNANYGNVGGAATKADAINEPFNARDVAKYLAVGTDGAIIRFSLTNTSAAIGPGTVINYIAVHHVAGANGTTYGGQRTSAGFRSNALDTFGAYASSPGLVEQIDTFGKDNDNANWTKTKLDNLELALRFNTPEGAHFVHAYVEIDFVADPSKVGAARDTGSRHQRLMGRPIPTVSGRVPLRFLDAELLSLVAWSHLAGPSTAGGWGDKKWQRQLAQRLSITRDLDEQTLIVSDLLNHRYLTYLWDPMISEEPPGPTRPGIPVLTPGAGRVYARSSKAWVENAAAAAQGVKQVVEIPDDVEKNTADGELFEGAAKNYIPRSSMAEGLTGLTAVGTAGQTTLDSAKRLFESYDSLKITRNATVEDQGRTWPASDAFAANEVATLSIDYDNDSGVACYAYAQRSTDGKYLRQSDWTWQTGIQYITLPVVSALVAGQDQRFRTSPFVVDTTGSPTVTVSVVHKSTDANGTISHVYHVQLEKNLWASSRMVTGAASFTRALDNLRFENFPARRVLPLGPGHVRLAFKVNWDVGNITVNPDLFKAALDASGANFIRLFYNPAASNLTFRRRVASTNYSAQFNVAIARGTLYYVTVRMTGDEGEHGLAPYTMDIFVNGVKGESATSVAFGTLTEDLYLWIGQDQVNLQHLEGWLRFFDASPYVPSDEEIAGWDTP